MSVIVDQVRSVNFQLDRLHFLPYVAQTESPEESLRILSSPRIVELQRIIKALSTSILPLLSSSRITGLLQQAALPILPANETRQSSTSTYETELHWLVVGKATIQSYGLLLETILEQTLPLVDEIWYWDEILGSYAYSSLFVIQKSPLRLWSWSKDIYYDTKSRFSRLSEPSGFLYMPGNNPDTVAHWKQFYELVKKSIQQRSLADLQRGVLSPIALCRAEARYNQIKLKRMREIAASGLGMLMEEALNFEIKDDHSQDLENDGNRWKFIVERSICLMDTMLRNVSNPEMRIPKFENEISTIVNDDYKASNISEDLVREERPAQLSRRLEYLLNVQIPNYTASSQELIFNYGRPSRIVRYWLPIGALILSSTTLLQLLVNRKENITRCVRSFGGTIRDFWLNWILEPIKRIVATIRHNPQGEIAIMSKESLRGDRDSLERMVVEFAIDNHHSVGSETSLSQDQISEIRVKVQEGDLTPVLRAYEKDLRNPLIGTFRGDLVRTLLIQVQKTKVDVEIALSGIDALLKSQELVFGFMGLTPGVLVCFATIRYLRGLSYSRRGMRRGHKAENLVRVLRNIDRILAVATVENRMISYKDYGLLLCEVHILRKNTQNLFPGVIKREFLEDVRDLCNIDSGLQVQLKALKRIRWSYAKWFR